MSIIFKFITLAKGLASDRRGLMPMMVVMGLVALTVVFFLGTTLTRSMNNAKTYEDYNEAVYCAQAGKAKMEVINTMATLIANCTLGQCVDFNNANSCKPCGQVGTAPTCECAKIGCPVSVPATTCTYSVRIDRDTNLTPTLTYISPCNSSYYYYTEVWDATAGKSR